MQPCYSKNPACHAFFPDKPRKPQNESITLAKCQLRIFHFYFSGIFQTPLVPLSNLSAPSAAAAVIRASSSVAGPVGITTPPTTAVAGIPPLGSRPSNDPMGPMVTSTSISAARRSVSPPAASSLGMGMDKSAVSAPHSPSPVGSMISKENSNSQQGGVPSPTYSQVREFLNWYAHKYNLTNLSCLIDTSTYKSNNKSLFQFQNGLSDVTLSNSHSKSHPFYSTNQMPIYFATKKDVGLQS